jgi:hypothetical protein
VTQIDAEVADGVLRHCLTTMGGALMMVWWLTGGTWEGIAGAWAVLLGFGWSLWTKRVK